jgi:hypothetical protein
MKNLFVLDYLVMYASLFCELILCNDRVNALFFELHKVIDFKYFFFFHRYAINDIFCENYILGTKKYIVKYYLWSR